jgi:hypothetical protein
MNEKTGGAIVSRHLQRVTNLPCWNVRNGYGSWLDFDFGRPSLSIREHRNWPRGPSKRRRTTVVRGQHHLWVELCDWTISHGRKRLAHSESVAATIAKAADWLNGQIVVSVDIRATPAWTRFRFDLGGELVLRRYAEWAADDDLWHFYSGTTSIHFGADGAVRKSGRNEGLSNKGYLDSSCQWDVGRFVSP